MEKNDQFDKFQLEEYKNISTAHFESSKQITAFFRFYLLVLAAPAIVLNAFTSGDRGLEAFLDGKAHSSYYLLAGIYFAVVSLIGFLMYVYIVNLRLDTILYARTVNRVRRYFYDNSNLDILTHQRYMQLPSVPSKPSYFELEFFLPILIVFYLINAGFLYIAFRLFNLSTSIFCFSNRQLLLIVIMYLFLHILLNYILVSSRKNYYLKSYKIGIDIDGVVSNQTEHFSYFLEKLTGKKMHESLLRRLPVHKNTDIGITQQDERIVFNTEDYWKNLPLKSDAANYINQFSKSFGLQVSIFTNRNWPTYINDQNDIDTIIESKNCRPLKKGTIARITQEWLASNGIDAHLIKGWKSKFLYNMIVKHFNKISVTVEMGNPHITDTRWRNYFRGNRLNGNRLQQSTVFDYRFFIEDDPILAIKIANVCEYVFLFNEPYNRLAPLGSFPKNVIRVESWEEITAFLKATV